MAQINISTEAPAGKFDLSEISRTVEDVTFLLKNYTELLFEAGQFAVDDHAQATRGANQIYALLTAVRTQLDKLEEVPDALMNYRRAMSNGCEGRAA